MPHVVPVVATLLKGGVGVNDETLKLCLLGRKEFATWYVCFDS
jgi:hypothetical protein